MSRAYRMTGENNPMFRPVGSRHVDDMGGGLQYWVVKCPDGQWRREHRVVMEEFLKRKLKRTEHVHHKNGDGLDNSIWNLELLDAKAHLSLTTKRRLHACAICGHMHLPGAASHYHACPDCGRTHQAKKR